MFENLVVIGRMNERIDLLRAEVEKRGMRWADAEVEEQSKATNLTNSSGQLVNGDASTDQTTSTTPANTSVTASSTSSGRLTDEELMARLQERMNEDEDEGVHL